MMKIDDNGEKIIDYKYIDSKSVINCVANFISLDMIPSMQPDFDAPDDLKTIMMPISEEFIDIDIGIQILMNQNSLEDAQPSKK